MKFQSSNSKLIHDISFDDSKKARYTCPDCSKSRSKTKAKDLEYFPDTKTFYCFHCGTTMYQYKPFEVKHEYTVPVWTNNTNLSDKVVKYFESRMISQKTLIAMNVYSAMEYMPQFKQEEETICFPFFRDGKLVNIKFRGPSKSFKLVSNAELIWYNFDCILKSNEIIICEGEIDALTFIENGFENVISVPNGAKSKSEYLDTSISALDHIEKIYLATDVDGPGIELKEELIRRLGAERCYSVNFKGCKDANEFYKNYGGYEFKDLLKQAKPIPVEGNICIQDFYEDILDLYENGIQGGAKIGNIEIDQFCTWELGRLCTVTGIPSSGKSEFVDYIIARLNLKFGWKAAYFTPENYPLKYHYAKLHEKFSGSVFRKDQDSTDFEGIHEHIRDNFFYILNEKDMTLDSVMKSAKSYVKQKGIKILVIDPYNKLDHQSKKGESETQYISRFLDVLVNFARFNNVLVFLVAHPVKTPNNEIPTLYSISGSANFYNKTDYGLTVHRDRDLISGVMQDSVQVHWQKIKFKHLGKQGVSVLEYNKVNGRFNSVGISDYSEWLNNKGSSVDFWDEVQQSITSSDIPVNEGYYNEKNPF